MRYFVLSLLGLIATAGFAAQASAEPLKFVLDKPHTQILFSINHMGFSNSVGKFTDYDGFVNFDEAEPAKSSAEVTIKTASLDLNDDKWNEHMTGPDFFNVQKFPEMTFKSTKVEVTGEKTANITGDLTLMGVTKPVVLATVFNQSGKNAMSGKPGVGFSATTRLKRSDFGLSNGIPVVGDDVEIMIEVEAYAEDKTAGGANNQ